MAFYIQYDENGVITGTLTSFGETPNCERQISLTDYVDISNSAVDPDNGDLIDITTGNIFNPETGQFEPDVNQSEVGFWQRIKSLFGL